MGVFEQRRPAAADVRAGNFGRSIPVLRAQCAPSATDRSSLTCWDLVHAQVGDVLQTVDGKNSKISATDVRSGAPRWPVAQLAPLLLGPEGTL
eukprot:1709845-Rhodomonas_salina.3